MKQNNNGAVLWRCILYHGTCYEICYSIIIGNTRTYSNWKENRDKYHDNWHLSRSFSFIAVIDGIPLHTESMQTAEGRFLIMNNKQQCNYAEQPNNIHGTAQRQSCSHSPTLTLQRKISLFSSLFVSKTVDNQYCVCSWAVCSTQACRKKCVTLRHVFRFG